jgi:hypothetical protein
LILTVQLPVLPATLLSLMPRYRTPESVVTRVEVPISKGVPLPMRAISEKQGRWRGLPGIVLRGRA